MSGLVELRNTEQDRRKEIDGWRNDPWYPVLVKLDADISALVPDYSLDQLKEKFGGLRYYVSLPDGTDPETVTRVNDLITEAERDSEGLSG